MFIHTFRNPRRGTAACVGIWVLSLTWVFSGLLSAQNAPPQNVPAQKAPAQKAPDQKAPEQKPPAKKGPPPEPDQITLNSGETLTGQMVAANPNAIIFRSQGAGNLTIPWNSAKELRSKRRFAAIRKSAPLTIKSDRSQVPQGFLTLSKQALEIRKDPQSPPVTIPLSDVSAVVGSPAFEAAFRPRSLFSLWRGIASVGSSMTRSTQELRNLAVNFNISRGEPEERWLQVRSRTTLSLQYVNNLTKKPSASIHVTSLNTLAERDQYLTSRVYLFALAAFEQSSSQGLELRQSYAGGPGFMLIKGERQTWEAWAALRFSKQEFLDKKLNHNIVGARIGQSYTRRFANGIVFNEMAGIAPAFQNTQSWFAGFSASLTVPVYRRLGITISSWDQFINEVPRGFKKNTLFVSIGATLTF